MFISDYRKRTLDIIIGDYGREGTIRFMRVFSDLERAHIIGRIKSNMFYDEYRVVDQIFLNALVESKSNVIEKYISEKKPFDDKILFGFENFHFQDEDAFVELFFKLVIDHIETGYNKKYGTIRVIVPCNTLEKVAKSLEEKISKIYPNVSVPTISGPVKSALLLSEIKMIKFLATPEVYKFYSDFFQINNFSVKYDPSEFSTILKKVVNGERFFIERKNELIISCCTDVYIPCSIDALELFCMKLLEDSYSNHKIWF